MILIIKEQLLDTLNYFHDGGIVMFPLLLSSILMWAMIINRMLYLGALEKYDIIRNETKEYILHDKSLDIGKYRGLRAQFVSIFLKKRCGKSEIDQYILDETVMSLNNMLDQYLAYIGVLAAVSPFFGLLGTVTGMMSTFDIIAIFGTGNAKAMAGGISEALISTQTGLLVAIPGLYMHNLLLRRADRLKQRAASTGYYLRRFV